MVEDKRVLHQRLELEIIGGRYSDSSDLQMTWDFVEVEPTHIKIQLDFNSPEVISTFPEPDNLRVTFWDLKPFVIASDLPEGFIRCELDDTICKEYKLENESQLQDNGRML